MVLPLFLLDVKTRASHAHSRCCSVPSSKTWQWLWAMMNTFRYKQPSWPEAVGYLIWCVLHWSAQICRRKSCIRDEMMSNSPKISTPYQKNALRKSFWNLQWICPTIPTTVVYGFATHCKKTQNCFNWGMSFSTDFFFFLSTPQIVTLLILSSSQIRLCK